MVGKEKLKERVRLQIHTAAEGHFLKKPYWSNLKEASS